MEQIPELAQMVLDGRSRGDHAKGPDQPHRGARSQRLAVLDGLGLVEHDGFPVHGSETVGFLMQQPVAAHHQVEGLEPLQHPLAVAVPELDRS